MGMDAQHDDDVKDPRALPREVDVVGKGLEVGKQAEETVQVPGESFEQRIFFEIGGQCQDIFQQIGGEFRKIAGFLQKIGLEKVRRAGHGQKRSLGSGGRHAAAFKDLGKRHKNLDKDGMISSVAVI